MSGWAFDDETTARHAAQLSGVHETPTEPAPYIDDLDHQGRLIGSIPRNQLTADFQPVCRLADGQTRGFEALPRCHAEGLTDREQLYARAAFEKTVGELGRAMREIAVRECAGSPVYLSVHPDELKDSWLVRPDDPICFHDSPLFLQVSLPALGALQRQILCELGGRSGISLVIDDFGTGPATLEQIVALEPRAVKIGGALIAGIEHCGRRQRALVRSVELCKSLGAVVIAKGVDTPAQAQVVRGCGVHAAQGRLFGEPAPLPTISAWP